VLPLRPGHPLIEDFSLIAEPGQTIAIVGPTGAGKTTVVNLLMRFYEIDSGRILLDGSEYRALTRGQMRAASAWWMTLCAVLPRARSADRCGHGSP
jgi:ABC-type multidrug transport system fused ATPase/permease subunit